MTPIERLEYSIKIMEDVRDRNLPFNMRYFYEDESKPMDCGTAACWAGWCMRDPILQAEGITATTLVHGLEEFFGIANFDDVNHIILQSYYSSDEVTPDMVIEHVKDVLAKIKAVK